MSSPDQESQENRTESDSSFRIPICPYWQRYSIRVTGDSYQILALCGRSKNKKQPLEDIDGAPRLPKCPWRESASREAYDAPIILEVSGSLREPPSSADYDIIEVTNYKGLEGIKELEYSWPRCLDEFITELE